jgi:hypothetical protein
VLSPAKLFRLDANVDVTVDAGERVIQADAFEFLERVAKAWITGSATASYARNVETNHFDFSVTITSISSSNGGFFV